MPSPPLEPFPTHPPPAAQDGEHAYIRLNFNYGGSYEPCAKFPRAVFVKELSFRSADTRHAAKVGANGEGLPHARLLVTRPSLALLCSCTSERQRSRTHAGVPG